MAEGFLHDFQGWTVFMVCVVILLFEVRLLAWLGGRRESLFDLLEEYQKGGRPGIPRDILLGFMADAAEGLDHADVDRLAEQSAAGVEPERDYPL